MCGLGNMAFYMQSCFFFFFFGSVVDDIHGETKDTCDDSEGYMEMVLEQCVQGVCCIWKNVYHLFSFILAVQTKPKYLANSFPLRHRHYELLHTCASICCVCAKSFCIQLQIIRYWESRSGIGKESEQERWVVLS